MIPSDISMPNKDDGPDIMATCNSDISKDIPPLRASKPPQATTEVSDHITNEGRPFELTASASTPPSAPESQQKRCFLLGVPTEIREMIWCFSMQSDTGCLALAMLSNSYWNPSQSNHQNKQSDQNLKIRVLGSDFCCQSVIDLAQQVDYCPHSICQYWHVKHRLRICRCAAKRSLFPSSLLKWIPLATSLALLILRHATKI